MCRNRMSITELSLFSYDDSNGSYLVWGTDYPDIFCGLPQSLHKKFQDITFELGHDEFIRHASKFIINYDPMIRRCIVRPTDCAVK
jgi:hypothetical protein